MNLCFSRRRANSRPNGYRVRSTRIKIRVIVAPLLSHRLFILLRLRATSPLPPPRSYRRGASNVCSIRARVRTRERPLFVGSNQQLFSSSRREWLDQRETFSVHRSALAARSRAATNGVRVLVSMNDESIRAVYLGNNTRHRPRCL